MKIALKNLIKICLVLSTSFVCPFILSLKANASPIITVFAPSDLFAYNTRRILVIGKVDGAGSNVQEVKINGKASNLTQGNNPSPGIFNFSSEVQFNSDGKKKITIAAKDEAGNTSEKSIEIIVDTLNPEISEEVEQLEGGFKIFGIADGTGSNIASILVNAALQTISNQGEEVDFSVFANTPPLNIAATDASGNRSEITISNFLSEDTTPPTVELLTPENGQIFKGPPEIKVSLQVVDNVDVKEVLLGGTALTESKDGIYSGSILLNPGENTISVKAKDVNNNESVTNINVSYLPNEEEQTQLDKLFITLSSDSDSDINTQLITQFAQIVNDGNLLNIGSIGSIEILNAPNISDGTDAMLDTTDNGLSNFLNALNNILNIPRGFSFASNINLTNSNVNIPNGQNGNQNTAILIDSTGRIFVVGFAFFNMASGNNAPVRKNGNFKFQTTNGEELALTTTITIPADATEGDAKVSILSGNNSLATVPIKVTKSPEVRVGKRIIPKPEISEPIVATLQKSGKQLVLKVKGNNFVKRIAIIDGKLEKLVAKSKFFTNVTFVPSEGIKLKKFKVVNDKNLVLIADMKSNIKAGVKLFNIITPRGADIGAIVFPDPIADGKLETTATPESLILEQK